jgi:hypothetical protein
MHFPKTIGFFLAVIEKQFPDIKSIRNYDPRGRCKDPSHLFWMIRECAKMEDRDKVQRWLAYVACSLEWIGVINNEHTQEIFKSDIHNN